MLNSFTLAISLSLSVPVENITEDKARKYLFAKPHNDKSTITNKIIVICEVIVEFALNGL